MKCTIADLLANKIPLNSTVTVEGWVRTRRDSKAGVSFITLNDGSGFKSLQIVAPSHLKNYSNEILKLTTGCSIIAAGNLIASPAAGQSVELQAENITIIGWVDDPDTYPISPKYHTV
ncbi:OB-fold nucleic acid binding domain-containing protein, partial [Dolichospermum sp. ST_sed4]|nr:OB-fold nucleic acid binding domain-containing protein [Dolichospermum sp. ST_sed4]